MKIQEFEPRIDERILLRGYEYFKNGKLTDLQNEGIRFWATVHGTDDYRVEASVDEGGEIVDSACDCPYVDGEYCKHEVALFYAIREQRHGKEPTNDVPAKDSRERPIDQLVKSLPRKQLEDLVLTLVQRFDDVESQIRFRAGSDDEKLKAAKGIIHSHINQARHHGFIESSEAGAAMDGVAIVFDEAMNCDALETGIALCLLGLDAVENVDGIDDSDGIITDMLTSGQESIERLLAERLESSSKPEQKSIFRMIMKHIERHWSDDLTFSGGLLVETLLPFCGDPEFANQYEKMLFKIESAVTNDIDSYSRKYLLDTIDILKLHLLDRTNDLKRRQAFIETHLDNHNIREVAIMESIAERLYDRALELIEGGIVWDKALPGIVNRWNHLAYQVHHELNHIDEVRTLSAQFVIAGEGEYYEPYLATFPAEERENAVEAILVRFERQAYATETYINILIMERKLEKVMALCEKRPSLIESLYVHLLENYRDRVDDCFKHLIRSAAAEASQRSGYQRICRTIKVYRKAFGDTYIQIVEELRKNYPRRSAMMDELNHIGAKKHQ
jgi:hypothetical protein